MKTKLLAMTAASVIALTASLLWLMDGKVQDERKQSLEAGLRGPVNALTQTVLADLRGVRRILPAAVGKDRVDWESFKPFYAIAQIRRTDSRIQVLHFANNGLWPVSEWTSETVSRLLSGTKAPGAKGASSMALVTGADGKKVLAVLVEEGDSEYAAFTGADYLGALLDLQKGPRGWLAIMNSNGQILAHSTLEYVGTSVSAGSLLDQVRKSASSHALETFENTESEPAMTAFEKPARTDLTVVGARSIGELRADRRKTLMFGAVAGLGILLLVSSILWTSLSRWEAEALMRASVRARAETARADAPKPSTKVTVTRIEPEAPARMPVAKADVLMVPQPTAKERKDTFARIASALAYELRSPLLAILGYGQTVLATSRDERVVQPTESILREARNVREVVDKLLAFSGDLPAEKKDGKLETVVAKVLKEFEPKFQQRHIKVTKDLRETGTLSMVPEALEKAVRHVLTNSIEAMERMNKKEISIKLSEDARAVRLEIRDSGEGLSKDDQARALDPFFTTRNPAQHLGMGLPAAFGTLREHDGTLTLESELGKGATVTFTLPKKMKTVEIAGRSLTLETEQEVQIPRQLPDAPAEVAVKPKSPADIDIDRLLPADLSSLAMDEDGARDMGGAAAEGGGDDLLDLSPAVFHPPSTSSGSAEDKDKTVVLPVDAARARPAGAEANPAGPSATVEPPRFQAPQKTSKLDSFRVDIRRPGSRV